MPGPVHPLYRVDPLPCELSQGSGGRLSLRSNVERIAWGGPLQHLPAVGGLQATWYSSPSVTLNSFHPPLSPLLVWGALLMAPTKLIPEGSELLEATPSQAGVAALVHPRLHLGQVSHVGPLSFTRSVTAGLPSCSSGLIIPAMMVTLLAFWSLDARRPECPSDSSRLKFNGTLLCCPGRVDTFENKDLRLCRAQSHEVERLPSLSGSLGARVSGVPPPSTPVPRSMCPPCCGGSTMWVL